MPLFRVERQESTRGMCIILIIARYIRRVVYKDVKRRGCTQAKIPRPSPQRGAAAK